MNVKFINMQIYYKCFLMKHTGIMDMTTFREYKKNNGNLSDDALQEHGITIAKIDKVDFNRILVYLNKRINEFNIDLGIEFKVKTIEVKDKIEDDSVITVTYNLIEKNGLNLYESDFMVFDISELDNMLECLENKLFEVVRYYKYDKKLFGSIYKETENKCNLLLSPDSTSKLFHEIFSHSFEEDYYQLNHDFKDIKLFFNGGINVIDNYYLKHTYDDLGCKINVNIELINNGKPTGNFLSKQTGNVYIDCFLSKENELVRTTNTFFEILYTREVNELEYPYVEIEQVNSGSYDYKESIINLVITRAYYHESNIIKKALEPFQFNVNINEIAKSEIYRIGGYENVASLCMKLGNVRNVKNYVSKTLIENVNCISME